MPLERQEGKAYVCTLRAALSQEVETLHFFNFRCLLCWQVSNVAVFRGDFTKILKVLSYSRRCASGDVGEQKLTLFKLAQRRWPMLNDTSVNAPQNCFDHGRKIVFKNNGALHMKYAL